MSQTTKKPITCGACGEKGHNKASNDCTKKERKLPENDNYTVKMLSEDLDEHIRHNAYYTERNKVLNIKKIRQENFPSYLSENFAKFVLWIFLGIRPNWNTTAGDLEVLIPGKKKLLRIEVKGFSSLSPSSFGTGEYWDWIVFVDCIDYVNKVFKVFLIKYGNLSETWRNVKMRKEKESEPVKTYGQIADNKRRGELRHLFYGESGIQSQFSEETCRLIFHGNLSELCDVETRGHVLKMSEFSDFIRSEEAEQKALN
jgi:hypothetical protein